MGPVLAATHTVRYPFFLMSSPDEQSPSLFDEFLAKLRDAAPIAPSGTLQPTREHIELALEASGIGLWTWDLRNDAVSWSPHVFRIHGLAPDEAPAESSRFFALVHPDDRARVQATVQAAIAAAAPCECEFRIVRPTGELAWVENRGRMALGADGRPAVMLGTIQDISTRRRAMVAQEELDHLYRELARNLPQGAVFVVDCDLLPRRSRADA